MRIAQIREEKRDIEREHLQPGNETIPRHDASWGAWRYGQASNWTTLYQQGGYSNQPRAYLEDMEWFNTWDYYYGLEMEETRLQATSGSG